MKTIQKTSFLLAGLMLLLAFFTSCEWDASEEPDHPLYVTYTISAGSVEFVGPDQLLQDIQTWIKANQDVYDVQVTYNTGDASEFAATDAEALKKYEVFRPKFKAYIEEVKRKLESGAYSDQGSNTTKAKFYISATRTQGQGGHLKYEEIELFHP